MLNILEIINDNRTITEKYKYRKSAERNAKIEVNKEIHRLKRLWYIPPEYWEKYYSILPREYLAPHRWNLIAGFKSISITISIQTLLLTIASSIVAVMITISVTPENGYTSVLNKLITGKNPSHDKKIVQAIDHVNGIFTYLGFSEGLNWLILIGIFLLALTFMYDYRRKLELRLLIIDSIMKNNDTLDNSHEHLEF